MTRTAGGGDGRAGRDVRIAVPIAADPVADAKRHGHAQRFRGRAELLLEGAHERLACALGGVEEPCLEIPEHGAHLVTDRGAVAADLRGEPEQLDLGLQLLVEIADLAGRRELAREQVIGDTGLERQERAARGLGGMRGEHGAHVESRDRLHHLVGRAAGVAQAAHGPACGSGLRIRIRTALVVEAAPHAVHLLRGVDQQEEEGEGPGDVAGDRDGQRIDAGEELVEGGRIGSTAAARPAGATQTLDRLVGRLALEPADDAAERGGESPNVLVKGDVLGTGGDDLLGGGGYALLGHGGRVRGVGRR